MCLNCGYTCATVEGFCSELCQREFTEVQEAESEEQEQDS